MPIAGLNEWVANSARGNVDLNDLWVFTAYRPTTYHFNGPPGFVLYT